MPQIRKWDWAGLILFGTAAMYSHNLAIFGLAAANLFLLIRREWKKLWALLGAQVVIGLLALPWLWLVPGQVEDDASIGEVRLVKSTLPDATCHFMHPIKAPEAIAEAFVEKLFTDYPQLEEALLEHLDTIAALEKQS